MQFVLIVTMSLTVGAVAQISSYREYGAPFPTPAPAPAPPQATAEYFPSQKKVYRHVYVHVAPPEEQISREKKVIRIPGGGAKHVNIIFVKAPSSTSQQKTEIILPEQRHRNLVYILVKKEESDSNIKFRKPQSQSGNKPEIYFIRYKNQNEDIQEQVTKLPQRPSPQFLTSPRPRSQKTLYGAPSPSKSQKPTPILARTIALPRN